MSQTIDVEVGPGAISPAALADIEKFERLLAQYLAGEMDEDAFRIFRLNNGIYGQRQGGTNQMVRVKVPYGSLQPEQLDMLAHLSETYSRGWGHITTRQNIQFHFVQLEQIPAVMRDLASVGLTTREACGDTVRNVMGCHLAGACPFEVLDISPWAEATFRALPAQPLRPAPAPQVQDQLLGLRHRLRPGHVQRRRRHRRQPGQGRRHRRARLPGVLRRRPGRQPPPGPGPGGVHLPRGPAAHPRGHPAHLRPLRQPRQQAAGPHEVAGRHPGRRRGPPAHPQGAPLPARLRHLAGRRPRTTSRPARRRARRRVHHHLPHAHGLGHQRGPQAVRPLRAAGTTPTWCGATPRAPSRPTPTPAWATSPPTSSGPSPPSSASSSLEVRVTNRQNFVFRGLTEEQLPDLYARLDAIGMAEPGAELARDVVSCPGADTCNLAVTQSRGLADEIGQALEEAGLADVGGVRINISGCTNSCGQHHISDIGFVGVERRAHGQSAPGYQMLLGGTSAAPRSSSATRRCGCRPRRAGEATVRVIGRFAAERSAGETFTAWLDRSGGAGGGGRRPGRPRRLPHARRRTPTSTSTTTRPAPTSPRWAPGSAPPAAWSSPRTRRLVRRSVGVMSTRTNLDVQITPGGRGTGSSPPWGTAPRGRNGHGRRTAGLAARARRGEADVRARAWGSSRSLVRPPVDVPDQGLAAPTTAGLSRPAANNTGCHRDMPSGSAPPAPMPTPPGRRGDAGWVLSSADSLLVGTLSKLIKGLGGLLPPA